MKYILLRNFSINISCIVNLVNLGVNKGWHKIKKMKIFILDCDNIYQLQH